MRSRIQSEGPSTLCESAVERGVESRGDDVRSVGVRQREGDPVPTCTSGVRATVFGKRGDDERRPTPALGLRPMRSAMPGLWQWNGCSLGAGKRSDFETNRPPRRWLDQSAGGIMKSEMRLFGGGGGASDMMIEAGGK